MLSGWGSDEDDPREHHQGLPPPSSTTMYHHTAPLDSIAPPPSTPASYSKSLRTPVDQSEDSGHQSQSSRNVAVETSEEGEERSLQPTWNGSSSASSSQAVPRSKSRKSSSRAASRILNKSKSPMILRGEADHAFEADRRLLSKLIRDDNQDIRSLAQSFLTPGSVPRPPAPSSEGPQQHIQSTSSSEELSPVIVPEMDLEDTARSPAPVEENEGPKEPVLLAAFFTPLTSGANDSKVDLYKAAAAAALIPLPPSPIRAPKTPRVKRTPGYAAPVRRTSMNPPPPVSALRLPLPLASQSPKATGRAKVYEPRSASVPHPIPSSPIARTELSNASRTMTGASQNSTSALSDTHTPRRSARSAGPPSMVGRAPIRRTSHRRTSGPLVAVGRQRPNARDAIRSAIGSAFSSSSPSQSLAYHPFSSQQQAHAASNPGETLSSSSSSSSLSSLSQVDKPGHTLPNAPLKRRPSLTTSPQQPSPAQQKFSAQQQHLQAHPQSHHQSSKAPKPPSGPPAGGLGLFWVESPRAAVSSGNTVRRR